MNIIAPPDVSQQYQHAHRVRVSRTCVHLRRRERMCLDVNRWFSSFSVYRCLCADTNIFDCVVDETALTGLHIYIYIYICIWYNPFGYSNTCSSVAIVILLQLIHIVLFRSVLIPYDRPRFVTVRINVIIEFSELFGIKHLIKTRYARVIT